MNSVIYSLQPVMKYVENGPVGGCTELHSAISELDYLPHERKTSSSKGEGYVFTIVGDGGWAASVRALFSKRTVDAEPEIEQSLQDEEEEVIERELSKPLSLTIHCQVSEIGSHTLLLSHTVIVSCTGECSLC